MIDEQVVEQLRRNLVVASRRATASGLQTGNGGNVSCRVPGADLMLVTASGGSLGDCTEESFLLTDFDGNVVQGSGKPTRETFMHGHVYMAKPEVGGIVHAHSPYAIVISKVLDEVPRSTWHSRLKIPGSIRVVDVQSPMVRAEDWHLVTPILEDSGRYPAFVLRDHGCVVCGGNIFEAEWNAELVEETAKIAVFSTLVRATSKIAS